MVAEERRRRRVQEAPRLLAELLVGDSQDGDLPDPGVASQHVFQLQAAHTVAAGADHVDGRPAQYPPVAVLAHRGVTWKF